jgi:hypothetical protein
MNIMGKLRNTAELGIGLTAVAILALAGCGGGGSSNSTASVVVSTFASFGFQTPTCITSDGTNLYVTDSSAHNIRKIDIATGAATIFAGSISGASGAADAVGTSALFNGPNGITIDSTKTNLYVADTNNNVIRQINISTRQVSTIAGTSGLSGASDASGTGASFNGPTGMTRIGTTLYVSDSNNNTIRQIVITNLVTASAAVSTLAGTAPLSGYDDGVGGVASNPTARFTKPVGLTNDGSSLYVVDSGNNDVRKIVPASGYITLVAGGNYSSPASGVGSTDAIGASARFNHPRGLTTDGTYLYVADSSNHTIRRIFIASGATTTLAGMAGASGAVDGSGSAARFHSPNDLIYIGGALYVADFLNGSIRKIQL